MVNSSFREVVRSFNWILALILTILLLGCGRAGYWEQHRDEGAYARLLRERPTIYVTRPTLFIALGIGLEDTRPAPGLELHNFIKAEAAKRIANVDADYEVCTNMYPRLMQLGRVLARLPYPKASAVPPLHPSLVPADPLPADLFPGPKREKYYLHLHSGLDEFGGIGTPYLHLIVIAQLYFVDSHGAPNVIGMWSPNAVKSWDLAREDPDREEIVAALADPSAYDGDYADIIREALDHVLEVE